VKAPPSNAYFLIQIIQFFLIKRKEHLATRMAVFFARGRKHRICRSWTMSSAPCRAVTRDGKLHHGKVGLRREGNRSRTHTTPYPKASFFGSARQKLGILVPTCNLTIYNLEQPSN
jgi:hypothetical protein